MMALQEVTAAAKGLKRAVSKTHHYTPSFINELHDKLKLVYNSVIPTDEIDIVYKSAMELYNSYHIGVLTKELRALFIRVDRTVTNFQMKTSSEQDMLKDLYMERVKNLLDQVEVVEGRCGDHGDWFSVKEEARRCFVRGKSLLLTSEASAGTSVVRSSSSFASIHQRASVHPSSVIFQETPVCEKNAVIVEFNSLGGEGNYLSADINHHDEAPDDGKIVNSTEITSEGSNPDLPLPTSDDEELVSAEVSYKVTVPPGSACLQIDHDSNVTEHIDELIVPPVSQSLQIDQEPNVTEKTEVRDQHQPPSEIQYETSPGGHVNGNLDDMNSAVSSGNVPRPPADQLDVRSKSSTAGHLPFILQYEYSEGTVNLLTPPSVMKFLMLAGVAGMSSVPSRGSVCTAQCLVSPPVGLDVYHFGFSPHTPVCCK